MIDFAKNYDFILDPVCIFNNQGIIVYANDCFCNLVGQSQVRIQNKNINSNHVFIKINDEAFDVRFFENLVSSQMTHILSFQTKINLQNIGHFRCEKINLGDSAGYILTVKDLTAEDQTNKHYKYRIEVADKKVSEMSRLIDLLQSIRLTNTWQGVLLQYVNYVTKSNAVDYALMSYNGTCSVIGEYPTEIHQMTLNYFASYAKGEKLVKYSAKKTEPEIGSLHFFAISPFDFLNTQIFIFFVFKSESQMEQFNHQSTLFLADQLNTVLNNISLREIANTDSLTKLSNSMFFRKTLTDVCFNEKKAQLVLFDVDFFKKINDGFGHPGGDAVLVFIGEKVPQIISQFAPDRYKEITLSRVGGEEFAMIIPNEDFSFAYDLSQSIRSGIEKSIVKYMAQDILFTISMGVASWDNEGDYDEVKVKNLYKAADDALYISKKSGRNQVQPKKESSEIILKATA